VKYNGQGTGPDAKEANAYIKATEKSFQIFYNRTIRVWYRLELAFQASRMYTDFKKCCAIFHELSDRVIAQKQADLANKKVEKLRNGRSFMETVLQQHKSETWDLKEVRSEIDSMIGAGADTTAHTLSFVLLLLAIYPEVQAKVFDEICQISKLMVDKKQTHFTLELLNQLTYTDQVIKETLRLFAPSPIIGRIVSEDVQLKSVDITLPTGTIILISTHRVHKDKSIWGEDAADFKPERFDKNLNDKRHAYSYIPFSAGPRNCIGHRFARISMKTVLFHISNEQLFAPH
jgi:cytochrome P450